MEENSVGKKKVQETRTSRTQHGDIEGGVPMARLTSQPRMRIITRWKTQLLLVLVLFLLFCCREGLFLLMPVRIAVFVCIMAVLGPFSLDLLP